MPEKTVVYERVIFTPEVIREADNILREILKKEEQKPHNYIFCVKVSEKEEWSHNNEEEFFADYRKGFIEALFYKNYKNGAITFSVPRTYTRVKIALPTRTDVEKVFHIFESSVDKCRLPKQPEEISEAKTEWVTETINKIETHCPIAAHKVRLALIKLDSENTEEWQNANMLIRDAWIELSQWLCQVNNIDTSDIPAESVVERLRKLEINKADERLFNLARASFNLYAKHHKRDIDLDTAVACVISTVVSMKTVIGEVFNAKS